MPFDATRPLFNQVDANRDGITDENEFSQLDSSALHGDIASAPCSGNCASRYSTDSRGFFLDPNPEISNRSDPGPAPTYTQNITIRYLQPPPLPPSGVSYFLVILVCLIEQELIPFRIILLEKCARLHYEHHLHFSFVNQADQVISLLHLFFVNIHLNHLSESAHSRKL